MYRADHIIFFTIICILFSGISVNAADAPFMVKEGLFNQSRPDDLGLTTAPGTETVTVFRPSDETDHFSNGVVMIGFKDHVYCQWQSSQTDEDAPETWVAYSRSSDGKVWSAPMTLVPESDSGYHSSGGWWVNGDTLVAYINMWPDDYTVRGGYTQYKTSTDGINWSEIKHLPMADGTRLNGIFEQDPHRLPSGRIIGAAHFQPGLFVRPVYTDDPSGIRGWKKGNITTLPSSGNNSREMEPSSFYRADNAVVMVFRDQSSTFFRLASVSNDFGANWTVPVLTNMPDSRSKQSAGNLPDGTAFQVGNPVNNKTRVPLVISLSKDGLMFDKAFVLREGGSGLQSLRYAGKAKSAGYSYPKSTIWNDYLYVSYATNKEDVEFTRVPLTSLYQNATIIDRSHLSKSDPVNFSFSPLGGNLIKVSLGEYGGPGKIMVYDVSGKLINRSELVKGKSVVEMKNRHGVFIFMVTADHGKIYKAQFGFAQ
jgi:hypothetical protein